MKRLIAVFLGITFMIGLFAGCGRQSLSNEDYVKAYDQILYDLEITLENSFYNNLPGFFELEGFDRAYSHVDQRHHYTSLMSVLDDVMFRLDRLGPMTDDPTIQTYQSKVEYALKEIKAKASNFKDNDSMLALQPNKNTLYREVNHFMTQINRPMLQFIEYDRLLDDYLDPHRLDGGIDGLLEMKERNRLRYTYTYFMTATFIAPMSDYTGLQVDPDRPWALWGQDRMVYEMAFSILQNFRDYYRDLDGITESPHVWDENGAEFYFQESINQGIGFYEAYYEVRKTYPHDFYQSNLYRDYQEEMGNKRIGYFHDFTEDHEDLVEMREAYLSLRAMLFDGELHQLMY